MNELQVFSNGEFGKVRIIIRDGEPWFVGRDVTNILGYSNSRDALSKRVDNEDKGVANCDTPSGIQEMTIINESGLYSLIFSSKLDSAKRFKRWVTSEILPNIRKNGSYGTLNTQQVIQIATTVSKQIVSEIFKEFKNNNTECGCDFEERDKKATIDIESVILPVASLKIEKFPKDFRQELDNIFIAMKDSENINFSAISRLCYKRGYPASNMAVKRYYQKYFD